MHNILLRHSTNCCFFFFAPLSLPLLQWPLIWCLVPTTYYHGSFFFTCVASSNEEKKMLSQTSWHRLFFSLNFLSFFFQLLYSERKKTQLSPAIVYHLSGRLNKIDRKEHEECNSSIGRFKRVQSLFILALDSIFSPPPSPSSSSRFFLISGDGVVVNLTFIQNK